jgi:hypothetical protein
MTCCKNERWKNTEESSEYGNKNKIPKMKMLGKMSHGKEGNWGGGGLGRQR